MKVVFDLGREYMKYPMAVKNLSKVLGVEPSQISTALSGFVSQVQLLKALFLAVFETIMKSNKEYLQRSEQFS